MDSKTLYTVVVADDEDELREAVCTMIPWQELGFRLVGSASNGLDALQLVEEREPDLLLTDIRMPFISGIELARQVRDVRPMTHIAFLSGYDDFEYAQQAIQYNIISYMLKPLTVSGLGQELRAIRQKIDAQFALFRQAPPQDGGQAMRVSLLSALALDGYAEPFTAEQEEEYERRCGFLPDAGGKHGYVVMVAALLNGDGSLDTPPSFAAPVDRLAAKYLRGASFYAPGKVVSVLLDSGPEFTEYLYVLTNEIPQMASRVLGRRCCIGVSRTVPLSGLHGAYCEAMEVLRQGDRSEAGARFIGDLAPAVKGGKQLCERAMEVLGQHYMDASLSLVSLSGMLGVSPNHLSACMKKYAGETFINILIRKRMEAAREMLSATSLRIGEIAARCGYTDQHYFSYCFKKYCGESPNSMRRRLDGGKAGAEA